MLLRLTFTAAWLRMMFRLQLQQGHLRPETEARFHLPSQNVQAEPRSVGAIEAPIVRAHQGPTISPNDLSCASSVSLDRQPLETQSQRGMLENDPA